jgi:hypothetical protein
MLVEITHVRQVTGDPRRKWFRSDTMDLIVWFSAKGTIVGFQLCYNRGPDEHALTWFEGKGFTHDRIDDGESRDRHKMTPILEPNGPLDKNELLKNFDAESANLSPELAGLVKTKVLEFEEPAC